MSSIDFLASNPAWLLATVFILSLLVGSFLNVVIYRLPVMMKHQWRRECLEFLDQPAEPETLFNLMVPRSRCPHCQTPIPGYYNIPIISYLLLRGRCAICQVSISKRYPAIELLTALLSAWCAWRFGWGPQLAASLVFTWSLVAASFIDIDEKLIPDLISLPLLWLGLLINLNATFTPIDDAVIGAIVGYGSLWAFTHAYHMLTGKFGMGHGDFKLFGALGAWFGWQMLPLILIASSVVGAVVGIFMLTQRNADRNTTIPFGPYLAVAGWIALLYGSDINQWYLSRVLL